MRTPLAFAAVTSAAASWAFAPTIARSTAHRFNETLIRRGYQGDLGYRSREGQNLTRAMRIATAIVGVTALLIAVTDLTSFSA